MPPLHATPKDNLSVINVLRLGRLGRLVLDYWQPLLLRSAGVFLNSVSPSISNYGALALALALANVLLSESDLR
jgi:hypothetical protein